MLVRGLCWRGQERLVSPTLYMASQETERENMLSLQRFKQSEQSKKKSVLRKSTYNGPVIRLHSVTQMTGLDGTRESHNFITVSQPEDLPAGMLLPPQTITRANQHRP